MNQVFPRQSLGNVCINYPLTLHSASLVQPTGIMYSASSADISTAPSGPPRCGHACGAESSTRTKARQQGLCGSASVNFSGGSVLERPVKDAQIPKFGTLCHAALGGGEPGSGRFKPALVSTSTIYNGVSAQTGRDRPAFLFRFSDAPVMKALSLYRDETRS
jgi:hypothetical protein